MTKLIAFCLPVFFFSPRWEMPFPGGRAEEFYNERFIQISPHAKIKLINRSLITPFQANIIILLKRLSYSYSSKTQVSTFVCSLKWLNVFLWLKVFLYLVPSENNQPSTCGCLQIFAHDRSVLGCNEKKKTPNGIFICYEAVDATTSIWREKLATLNCKEFLEFLGKASQPYCL